MSYSPLGRLYVGDLSHWSIFEFNTLTQTLVRTITLASDPEASFVTGVAFSRDGVLHATSDGGFWYFIAIEFTTKYMKVLILPTGKVLDIGESDDFWLFYSGAGEAFE